MISTFHLTLLLLAAVGNVCAGPTVKTALGQVEGFHFQTPSGFDTEVFLGIPFAQPPIDELRFEKPRPISSWSSKLNASAFGARCASNFASFGSEAGQEDCLTLSLVRPATASPSGNGYPVMVFVHGGAFLLGSGNDYMYKESAEYLVKEGLILVAINYRLGSFGFFSTGDTRMPGNLGLWDQVEALRFVNKVIGDFGGDADAITVFGESAGASSTSWLALSPHTEGLFARFIPMSGSAGVYWGSTDEVVDTSKKLSDALGCDWKHVKKCIATKSVAEIQKVSLTFLDGLVWNDQLNLAYFNPRLDGEFFQADNFKQAVAAAPKRSVLIGLTSLESSTFVTRFPGSNEQSKYMPLPMETATNLNHSFFREIVEHTLAKKEFFGTNAEKVADEIVAFYEEQMVRYPRNHYANAYAQLFSDLQFNVAAIREAKLRALQAPVFFYRYSFVAPEHVSPITDGAKHASELRNFFSSFFFPPVENTKDVERVRRFFTDLFVSFAKTGAPTTAGLKAVRVTETHVPFLDVNLETSLHADIWPERVAFWDDIATRYGFDLVSGKPLQQSGASATDKTEL